MREKLFVLQKSNPVATYSFFSYELNNCYGIPFIFHLTLLTQISVGTAKTWSYQRAQEKSGSAKWTRVGIKVQLKLFGCNSKNENIVKTAVDYVCMNVTPYLSVTPNMGVP